MADSDLVGLGQPAKLLSLSATSVRNAFTMPSSHSNEQNLTKSFVKILMEDVMQSSIRLDGADTPNHRRDFVRTCFAAIEGLVWHFRDHTLSVARAMYELTPEEEAALSESAFQVSAQGKVTKQPRYVALLPTMRLLARIAEKIEPTYVIDFNTVGWSDLQDAIAVRNRLTHPKSNKDLIATDVDIQKCRNGYVWLFDAAIGSMERSNSGMKSYLAEMVEIHEKLKSGDPEMVATYEDLKKKYQDQDGDY